MQAYIQSIGAWEIVRPDLLATVEWLKGDGKSEIGVCFYSFPLCVVATEDGMFLD